VAGIAGVLMIGMSFGIRISGSLTFLGASILMMVSLAEVDCYMAALDAAPSSLGLIGNAVGHVIQHLYFIVAAPAVIVPFGVGIRNSRLIPKVFGTLAIVLGAVFFVLGVRTLYDQILSPAVTSLAAIQAL
jgi:hypothetical protein